MLRDVCKALKGSPWRGTDIATIGGEPAHEKLSKITDQIERETLPRPRFEDGEPVQFGDDAVVRDDVGEVVEMKYQDGRCVEVTINFEYDSSATHYTVVDGEHVKRHRRPEPPKVLDADGVEIKVGDEVWHEDGTCGTVMEIDGEFVIAKRDGYKWWTGSHCSKFTHKRPEPEDSWEQIEADASDDIMVLDFVRRCKALAGSEAR